MFLEAFLIKKRGFAGRGAFNQIEHVVEKMAACG